MKFNLGNTFQKLAGTFLLATAAAWQARADFPTLVQSYNPLAYWRLDEVSNSPALNLVTNATAAGSVYNGVISGGALPGSPGLIGSSIQFTNYLANAADKTDDDETYVCQTTVNVPYAAALNAGPPFSIEFWINATTLGEDSFGACPICNLCPDWYGGANASGWGYYLNENGRLGCYFGNTTAFSINSSTYEYQIAGAGVVTNSAAAKLAAGNWYHVVTTWNGAYALMYINGVQVGSNNIPVANWVANQDTYLRFGGDEEDGVNASPFALNLFLNSDDYIGDSPLIAATDKNGSSGFNGKLQHVAIYPSILTTNVIASHYKLGTNVTVYTPAQYETNVLASAPVAYWPMTDALISGPTTNQLVTANNIGSEGSAANATEYWGTSAGSAGPDFLGLGTNDTSVFFDGFTGYIEAANDPALQIKGKLTVAAWVKPLQEDFFRDIVENGFDGYYEETFLRISPGNTPDGYGNGNYYEFGGSSQENYYDSALYPIPPGDFGNWVFLAGTFDGVNWNLYRNGALVAQTPADALALDTGAYPIGLPWTIGGRYPLNDGGFIGQENSFGGSIKDVAIFNRALTAAQVAALYNAADVPATFAVGPAVPGTVYTGDTFTFSATAQGSPPLGFQWYTNGVAISGQTASSLTLANVTTNFDALYSVVVTNQYGGATDSVSLVVATSPPLINLQPVSEQLYTSFPFSLSVGVSGSLPATYQWLTSSNKVALAGLSGTLTSNSLPLPAANLVVYSNIVGSITTNYSLMLANAYGAVTSSLAVITPVPLPPPGYPSNVLASGPAFFWRLNETNKAKIAFDDVGGQNGSYSNVTTGTQGYYPLPNSPANGTNDTAATFAVGSKGYSYVAGINGTNVNFSGSNVSFTVEAWVEGSPSQADQATIIAKGYGDAESARTEQFALDFDGVYNEYRFFVTSLGNIYETEYTGFYPGTEGVPNGAWQHVVGVYDGGGQLGSPQMYLYVNGQLIDQENVPALGPNPTTYPVSIGSKPLGSDGDYDGNWVGSIQEVAIYPYALSGTTVYNHYVGAYGTTLPPIITIQPTPVTNYVGLPVVLTASAAGSPTVTYQWEQNGIPVSNPIAVGVNSSLLLITNIAYSDAGNYTCVMQNGVGTTNTVSVPLVVLAPPTNPPVIPGLVVHLPFNGNLQDYSGFGNNGTGMYVANDLDTNEIVVGGVTNIVAPDSTGGIVNPNFFYTPGPYGTNLGLYYSTYAVQTYPGESIGLSDYFVTLGTLDALNFGSNELTVAYWIQLPRGYSAGDLPFVTDTVGSTLEDGFSFSPAYGYGTAYPMGEDPTVIPNYGGWCDSIFGSGVGISYFGDEGSINDGNWHHLVHIVNPNADTFVTYLDGHVAHQVINYGTDIQAAGDIDVGLPTNIGQDATGSYGETGSAAIADLMMWRTALTPLQVGEIYTAAISNAVTVAPEPVNVISASVVNTNKLVLSWPFGSLYYTTNLNTAATNFSWTLLSSTSPYTVTNFNIPVYSYTTNKNGKITTNSAYAPQKFFQTQW